MAMQLLPPRLALNSKTSECTHSITLVSAQEKERQQWINENCQGYWWRQQELFTKNYVTYYCFSLTTDLMLFKLRWE